MVTNKQAHRWGLEDSALCTFCNDEVETIVYLFVSCKCVQKIWIALKKWLKYFCNIDFEIEAPVILFDLHKDSFPALINTIILVTKYYLYSQKVRKEMPRFLGLLKAISKYKKIEQNIARRNANSEYHNKKWEMYDMI